MEKKWCLLKVSDGSRGTAGKKKIYEVTVSGSIVKTSWGMAEKTKRQEQIQQTYSDSYARQLAFMKVQEKLDKGYELAYSV
jgi:predicted DNA-binding WGR domain protein